MEVAVIGSGIGGLAAAHLSSRFATVTLYERLESPGMGAHSVRIGSDLQIDVPLRVFYDDYYPNLISLYRDAGIEVENADYSPSFSDLGGQTYFSYRNLTVAGRVLPFARAAWLRNRRSRRITRDLLRLYAHGPRDLRAGRLASRTLESYLHERKLSPEFVDGFLLPIFAGICTCDRAAVLNFPADVVVDYMVRGGYHSNVKRATGGSANVIARLTRTVHEIRCGAGVTALTRDDKGVQIHDETGECRRFDHAIVATQANHATGFLKDASPQEQKILEAFRYQPSRVLMHRDPRLAPRERGSWTPVMFIIDPASPAPMATLWMNPMHKELHDQEPVFQTWNPLLEPDPDLLDSDCTFERPLVDADSLAALGRLSQLHEEPERRVWFCGSYAQRGIPLLESAVSSASGVASKLQTLAPGRARPTPASAVGSP